MEVGKIWLCFGEKCGFMECQKNSQTERNFVHFAILFGDMDKKSRINFRDSKIMRKERAFFVLNLPFSYGII